MAMPESVLQEWELLNEQNQQEACSYISLLLSRQNDGKQRVNPPRKLGILADRFHGISEDFDVPLSDFEDYLE